MHFVLKKCISIFFFFFRSYNCNVEGRFLLIFLGHRHPVPTDDYNDNNNIIITATEQ